MAGLLLGKISGILISSIRTAKAKTNPRRRATKIDASFCIVSGDADLFNGSQLASPLTN